MKNAMKSLAKVIHQTDRSAAFAFEFWDGDSISYGSQPKVVMRVKTPETAEGLVTEGFMGFGKAYVAGDLEVEGHLQELLRLGLAIRFDEIGISLRQKLRFLPTYLKNRNTRTQALKNIAYHYDRGDGFYALYLDKTMTYSCAYFKNEDDSLEQAQVNKYEHIARKLMLLSGDSLLDVGCGWGGMLIHAAREYGVKGLGNTLSRSQCRYAARRIQELGLHDRIQVVLEDYRNLEGSYDAFVSIGMFEHVGREYLPFFFRKISRLLKKGGLGLLHTIGKEVNTPGDPWIMKYIFPGAYIPNLPEIVEHMGRAGLSVLDIENLRLHYARTLDCWAENFERNIEKVREMFDEAFVRMWRLYMNACAAGFRYGSTRLYQILFSNGLNNELPMTREHLYKS